MLKMTNLLAIVFILIVAATAGAANRGGLDEAKALMDSARVMEADEFAPGNWEKATKAFNKARQAVVGNKSQKSVNKEVTKAREYTENAVKATEVAKLSLEQYLDQRAKAIKAGAIIFVPELYAKAKQQFLKATKKVESGDVKGGLKEAEKSKSLFSIAELEAIRFDIIGNADKMIEKALADDAGKYALSTLDKAKTARTKSDAIITRNRYDRVEAEEAAALAVYEARHASNIALSVRSLNRNDQAWEKLMLIYEIQMYRVGEEVGLGRLPFDKGPLAAADSIITHIKALQANEQATTSRSASVSNDMSGKLVAMLSILGVESDSNDPQQLADLLSDHVEDLNANVASMREEISSSRVQYAALTEEHQTMSGELSTRLEKEAKFRKAKSALNPSEGEVLFNSSNDIVLRLSGLSFDIGKSDIKDSHVALLEKVNELILLFPDAQLMIEGHTDASGDPSANIQLSEKRAFAVMQYIRQSLLISADKIRSMGYGADHPIASNQNKSGRAKNRRIDIIIMQ